MCGLFEYIRYIYIMIYIQSFIVCTPFSKVQYRFGKITVAKGLIIQIAYIYISLWILNSKQKIWELIIDGTSILFTRE